MLRIALIALTGALVAGCQTAAFNQNIPVAKGPSAEIVQKMPNGALACVAGSLTPKQRNTSFGVIEIADRTGTANLSGSEAYGSLNTQGAADMAASSLARAGVKIIEVGAAYRALIDWSLGKTSAGLTGDGTPQVIVDAQGKKTSMPNIPLMKGIVAPMEIGIYGAITSSDPMPGGGIKAGAFGVTAGYHQDRMLQRIDLRAVRMPVGATVGGEVIATTTITKQVVQDGVQVNVARYFGSPATLVTLDAGMQRREPLKFSTGDMLDVAVADLLSQVYDITTCLPSATQVASK